jgi:hypothetical protein
MSNDMKTIMESWRDVFKGWDFSQGTTRARMKQNRAKVAAEEEKEERRKAQDKKDSAFAQAVAAAMGSTSGTVFPGTAQGREDVLDAVEGGYEKVKDFEGAMALLNMIPSVNIKKPEDIPGEVLPVLLQLVLARLAAGKIRVANAEARLIDRFPYHKDMIINALRRKAGMKAAPFVLAKKLPALELSIYGILGGALQMFGDDFLVWFLGSAMAAEPEEETKK